MSNAYEPYQRAADLGTPGPKAGSKLITLTIDGDEVTVPEGTTVLRAAALNGVTYNSGPMCGQSGCVTVASKQQAGARYAFATDDAPVPTRPATIATGSSVSVHGRSPNTPGCSATRGASSSGTTRTASPARGSTSMVSRSSGIAS